jgi:hypothetical protein
MFEKALIRRIDGSDVDLGLIAETMFFYGKTQLLLDRPFIITFANRLSLKDFQRLIESETVSLSYRTGNLAVYSTGAPRAHKFVEFFTGGEGKKRKLSAAEEIDLFLSRTLAGGPDKNAIKRLLMRSVEKAKFPVDEIPKLTDADVADPEYLISGIEAILNHLVPEYPKPKNLEFSLHKITDGYVVVTNLEYSKINEYYHKRIPASHSSISSEYLLSFLQDARADTYFAAHYLAELVTTPLLSDLIRLKHFEFLMRKTTSDNDLVLFQDVALPNFPSIRDVVNSGERSFSEMLDLIEEAKDFRSWIGSLQVDSNLVAEYLKAATNKTWADRLPTKSVRFAIATGVGLLGELLAPTGISTAIGVSAGATDTFLLDKIVKGWRPNQFIESRMREFLSPDRQSNHSG